MDVITNTLNKILYKGKHKHKSGGKMVGREKLHQDTYFGKKGDIIDFDIDPGDRNVWFLNRGPKYSPYRPPSISYGFDEHGAPVRIKTGSIKPPPLPRVTQTIRFGTTQQPTLPPAFIPKAKQHEYFREPPKEKHYVPKTKGGKKCIR